MPGTAANHPVGVAEIRDCRAIRSRLQGEAHSVCSLFEFLLTVFCGCP
jgi:hypothetical protein